ncbi:sugar kinase [Aliivibrio wodanis]|uniref:sugar kinase n=1 Tax=Aliivibrio wodanis TaxID=80852 RepID=UPI00406BE5F0
MDITNIAIIGECMVELKEINGIVTQGFGGDTLNTAIYLSRSLESYNITVSYLTCVGKDNFTENMLDGWNKENINTDMVRVSTDKNNGIYSIKTDSEGERIFNYWRNDSAAKYWITSENASQITIDLLTHQLVYLSGISLAILTSECRDALFSILENCKSKGIKIAFDNNYRPTLWNNQSEAQSTYKKILSLTDIAFLTFDDEQLLWGDDTAGQAIHRTIDLGVSEIIIKRGKDDCIVYSSDNTSFIPSVKVTNVIDTTAAGDSFSAGYLSKRVLGCSGSESAVAGHKLASTVIQYHGAIIPKSVMPI